MTLVHRSPLCAFLGFALWANPLPALGLAAGGQGQDSPAETIECKAAWGPVESSVYPTVRENAAVKREIESGPRIPVASHELDVFRALLPTDEAVLLDDEVVWEIDVERLLPFLRQLHPGVTTRMRHARPPADLAEILRRQGDDPDLWPPRSIEGGRATWLHRSDDELAILVRVHVEFELVPGELYLLPAQFEGRLVWDRRADRPKSFHLALPPRNTNFDLNYLNSVDIGYLPLMEVATDGATPAGEDAEPARARLRSSFYRFSSIDWRPLDEALARARENGRRLHVVQLFGTLDDESC